MDWTQTLTIIISVFGTNLALISGFVIFLLGRMDSNKRDLDQKMESAQKDSNSKLEKMLGLMDSNQKENNSKFECMSSRFNALENRLTAIEVEAKNTNQRISSIEAENKDISKRLSSIEGYLVPKKVFYFEGQHKNDHEEPKEN